MDKYEDLGLEASKFIEDLNMYEASRDGLFRVKRDAGNNPDFEETRRVFASKMTKIHMQKHQEEIARSNLGERLNGGHVKIVDGTFYTKDRPPISNSRHEAASKPPIVSGPSTCYEGQKHHPTSPHDARVFSYGSNHDTKDLSPSGYNPSLEPGNPYPQPVPGPVNPSGTWASKNNPQYQSSSPTLGVSSSAHGSNVNRGATPPHRQSSPCQTLTSAGKPDWFSASATGAHGEPDSHQNSSPYVSPTHQPPEPYRDPRHNGLPQSAVMCSAVQLSPLAQSQPEAHQPKGQVQCHTQGHSSPAVSDNLANLTAVPTRSDAHSPPQTLKLPCNTLHIQPEPGPSAAEIKLEALTERLEKEMDAQPTADYFGKADMITPRVITPPLIFFSSVILQNSI